MKKSPVILVGYSGHSYVVIDILKQNNITIKGYLDLVKNNSDPYSLKYIGSDRDDDVMQAIKNDSAPYFISIGDNMLRSKIDNWFKVWGLHAINAIHPGAIISESTKIGSGNLFGALSVLSPCSEIGNGVILNTGSVVEHECMLGDYVHIGPGAILAGNVSVGACSFIGANACIKQNVKIGRNVTVGAGSTVLKDIPDNQTWVGSPAKILKK